MHDLDETYLATILNPIRVCAHYKPKFGQGVKIGLSLDDFQKLYAADPFYSWFGLDNSLMYAAHKAAGGMTSLYRQIGIGAENLLRDIIKNQMGLAEEDVRWSYQVPINGGRTRTLSLDARIPTDLVRDETCRDRIQAWMEKSSRDLDIDPKVTAALTGIVFEIRQGYKSKDSKRQNADIANAAAAYTKRYLPCAIILSTQIDSDLIIRYRAEKWMILIGAIGPNNPLISTYDFFREVIGFDLAAFFDRNSATIRTEVDAVLGKLLTPK